MCIYIDACSFEVLYGQCGTTDVQVSVLRRSGSGNPWNNLRRMPELQ